MITFCKKKVHLLAKTSLKVLRSNHARLVGEELGSLKARRTTFSFPKKMVVDLSPEMFKGSGESLSKASRVQQLCLSLTSQVVPLRVDL